MKKTSYTEGLNNLKKNLQEQLFTFNYISSELLLNSNDNIDDKNILKTNVINENYIIDKYLNRILIKHPYLADLMYKSLMQNKSPSDIIRKTMINSINEPSCNICFEKYSFNKYGVLFICCGHSCCYDCFCQIKTPSCHMCRTEIKKAVKIVDLKNCIKMKISDNIIDTVLNLVFFSDSENFSNKCKACKILFNLPIVLNIKYNNFNEILMNYLTKTIKLIEPRIIAFFAAVYYFLYYSKEFQEKYSGIYTYKKIDINILNTLLYSPDIFLYFLNVLNSDFINININEPTFNLNCVFKIINQPNTKNLLNNIFNNQNKKNLALQIINNFKINQRTCAELFKNNKEFRLIFDYLFSNFDNSTTNFEIDNIKIFNNYIFLNKKNDIYSQFLHQIRIRGLKEINNNNKINNKIVKINHTKYHNKIFICTYRNVKFSLHSNNLTNFYSEVKFFLLLNKEHLNLKDDEIINSKNEEYSVVEFNENSVEII